MSTPSYTVSAEAYYKIFFHTAKHPHKPVNGVLLGTQSLSGKSGTTRGPITIADAVPLLHHWTSLSPMMEIGLDLVRSLSPLCCCDKKVNGAFYGFLSSIISLWLIVSTFRRHRVYPCAPCFCFCCSGIWTFSDLALANMNE